MKMRTKARRAVLIVLVFSLLILAFVGCSSSKDGNGNATQQQGEGGGDSGQGGSRAYQQYMDWLKQYDKWVDSYIAVCNNYKKNPTAYMSDYLTKTNELVQWTEKFEDIDDDDMTTAEALKVSNEYLRIYNKMMKAVSQ